MRKCLFCSNQATSHEHYFPEWVLKLTSGKAPYRLTVGTLPAREVYAANARTKQVCEECNHGWMSDLEGEARRILGPMSQDLAGWLDVKDQETITRWCIKTAMVFESLTSPNRERWFNAGQRQLLRTRQLALNRTLVWIGRYSSTGLGADGKDLRLVIPDIPDVQNGCLTHFLLDHLLIQSLSVTVPEKHRDVFISFDARPGPWPQSLIRVWPPGRTVRWPPPLSFSSSGFPTMGDLMGRFSIGA